MAKKTTAAKKPATTKAPPLPGMPKDISKQKGVTPKMTELGLLYLRSKVAENEAKAARKAAFATLASKMHSAAVSEFWLIDDNGERRDINIKAGAEKITAKVAKAPSARTARAKAEAAPAAKPSRAANGSDAASPPTPLPAGPPERWPVDHLGSTLLRSHVGQDAFESSANAGRPIGLTPDQVAKLSEKLKVATIGELEALMVGDQSGWWKPLANKADSALVSRVVESLGAFRRAIPHAAS